MDKPLKPGGGDFATTLPARPGGVDRPGQGNRPGNGGRPGIGDRPGNGDRPRPGDRPGIGDRPGPGNRPGIDDRPNFADRDKWSNNRVINNRPTWANIDRSTNINIHNNWNNAFVNPRYSGWWNRPANRIGYWNGWGNGVRNNWRYYHYHNNWFTGGWWNRHYFPIGGWHYCYWRQNYPWNYWWRVPVWGSLTSWFVWSAPANVWSQPVYYDYGQGGNVTYENNYVYIGGDQVATTQEFAQSAMDLATVAPPESEEQAAEAEWMPLGTFAVSTDEKDTEPSMVLQLAVDKQGVISGTLYNIETDSTQAVQGQVDKDTQRVAFRFGESEEIVAETGLYNLTQDEAPLLVHFGTDRVENYLLVRMEQPEEEGSSSPQE
ncbi:MAG: hypothetical protein R3C02_15105 [Planctomycetaceae bacterium]